jgi:hypothetical protein
MVSAAEQAYSQRVTGGEMTKIAFSAAALARFFLSVCVMCLTSHLLMAATLTVNRDQFESNLNLVNVIVTGASFPSDLQVSVGASSTSGGSVAFQFVQPVNGNFSLSLTIPVNQKPDVWTIRADQNTKIAAFPLTVTTHVYFFSWTFSPTLAKPSQTVTISRNHLPPGEGFQLSYQPNSGTAVALGNYLVDASGNFSVAVIMPATVTVGYGNIRLQYVSGGLTNLSSHRFGIPTQFAIPHVEYNQVVQRWDNSVPMVAGKMIGIRVYVQANGPLGSDPGGQIILRDAWIDVSHNFTLLGRLFPLNSSISVAPTPLDPKTLRGVGSKTFNFLIPSAWAFADGIDIHGKINESGQVPEVAQGDNLNVHLYFDALPLPGL